MRRTPQYLLPFQQSGDRYSASIDLERNVVVDNQLEQISSIVGDGILSGWTVSLVSGLEVKISPGSGFIGAVVHRTLSEKALTVVDNATSAIYMKSGIFDSPGGFPIETEGPFSAPASATFTDTTPPSIPTSFVAASPSFDVVNLSWDANTEADFDHYVVERSPDGSSWEVIAEPATNGVFPSDPYQDVGLDGSTDYYYRIAAVDRSGNQSDITSVAARAAPYPVTTAFDSRQPADPTRLRLFPGNRQVSIVIDGSTTADVASHVLTISKLNFDGSVNTTYDQVTLPAGTDTHQLTALTGPVAILENGTRYRVTAQAKRANGVTSNGTSKTASPASLPAPMDGTSLAATPGPGSVTLSWTASSSTTGASLGQKSSYKIRVIIGEVESAPIDVGLATSRLVDRYNQVAAIGQGAPVTLVDDVEYLFKITTTDSFGNESGGIFVKSTTIDLTPPGRPRALAATEGDASLLLQWRHSASEDVVDYLVSYSTNGGVSYSAEASTGYQEQFELTGLANDVAHLVRLRAEDDAGNLSAYASTAGTPTPDVVPPEIPLFVQLNPGDGQVKVSWKPVPDKDLAYYEVRRQAIFEPLNTPPNLPLTVIAGSEILTNVGTNTDFVDVGLTNAQVYAYAIRAVDASGNESDFSANFLVAPSEGLNFGPTRIDAPFDLSASFGGSFITLVWDFTYPGQFESPPGFWNYPSGGPTDFNVYRSESPSSGFQLLASVPSSTRTHVDSNLVSGTTYYYLVTAVRDNASPIADTGGVQPANTVLIATVRASGGVVTSITHEQRLLEGLYATLSEETLARLTEHRHLTRPGNLTEVEAIRLLPTIDVNDLDGVDLAEFDLSAVALSYYERVQAIAGTMTDGTIFVVDPSIVSGNPPLVGDFQITVDSARPSVSFTLDEDLNAIVFATPIQSTSSVVLDGLGYNYYLPTPLVKRSVGEIGLLDVLVTATLDIQVDGVASATAAVNFGSQVIRFAEALPSDSVVTAQVEPLVPEFGGQEGSRQVSLSQGIVLADFVADTARTYRSLSGAFSEDDILFVLVNGERTTLGHFINFPAKSIVFDDPLGQADVVSIEIQNEDEVQGEMPQRRIDGVDASEFTSGRFLAAQLPEDLSHAGRVREMALPLFTQLSTSDKYVYSAGSVSMGTATTAYSLAFLPVDGFDTLLLGTSAGVLRESNSLFLTGEESVLENDPDAVGIRFSASDDVVDLARRAVPYSGKLRGTLDISNALPGASPGVPYPVADQGLVETAVLTDPSIIELDDGRVLVCGGRLAQSDSDPARVTTASLVYDPGAGTWTNTGYMNRFRSYHALVLLPSGSVMAVGGVLLNDNAFPPRFSPTRGYEESLDSVDVFNPGTLTWALSAAAMTERRHAHSATLIDPSDPDSKVLVAGGRTHTPTSFIVEDSVRVWGKETEVLKTAEIYDPVAGAWSATGSLSLPTTGHQALRDEGSVLALTQARSELYDVATGTWSSGVVPAQAVASQGAVLDGPVKQFLVDSDGLLWAVTRKGVFLSQDGGRNYGASKGIDAAGVVHRVAEAGGTLFAATDLGVYVLTKPSLTWFQGGLLGVGTTETFDLLPLGSAMLAATEIGVFSTSDDGDTWTQLLDAQDVRALEAPGAYVLALAGQDVYRSADSGITWSQNGPFAFVDDSVLMLARGQETFVGTATGLWRSVDAGSTFSRVNFDHNRDAARNAVHMLESFGDDVAVGYDNVVFLIDSDLNVIRLAEFSGVVPTIRANGIEARNGFRYDTTRDEVTFEVKRLVNDDVDAAVSYSTYQAIGGGWYAHNPDAAVIVHVNGEERDAISDAWLGRVAFDEPLDKFDEVRLTIPGTTIRGEGEHFHDELEDALELEKGLPLSLGRDHVCNLLQLGLSVEHNFWERGLERDQYYCVAASEVDRSFNTFLANAEFFILGRRDYDEFNSTIDYAKESEQAEIGSAALVPLSALEVAPDELWVGTDAGVFILDPIGSPPYAVASTIQFGQIGNNPVRDLKFVLGDVYAATRDGLFFAADDGSGLVVTRNAGHGLPGGIFSVGAIHNSIAVGTNDGVYYSDSNTDPPYEVWAKGSFVSFDGQTALPITGRGTAMIARDGVLFASVDNEIFSSDDGKVWRRIFTFSDKEVRVNAMAFFSERLYLATNKGVYDDNATARSGEPTFRLDLVEATEGDSKVHTNDVFASIDSLYVAGNFPHLYRRQSESWTKVTVDGASSVHRFIITSGGDKVALSNNLVLVE